METNVTFVKATDRSGNSLIAVFRQWQVRCWGSHCDSRACNGER